MPRGDKNFGKTHGFKKGDPRINRKGAPRKLPLLKALMNELLGGKDGEDITKTEAALVVKALIKTAKDSKSKGQASAAKELMDRAFGKARAEEDEKESAPIIWQEQKTYITKKTK